MAGESRGEKQWPLSPCSSVSGISLRSDLPLIMETHCQTTARSRCWEFRRGHWKNCSVTRLSMVKLSYECQSEEPNTAELTTKYGATATTRIFSKYLYAFIPVQSANSVLRNSNYDDSVSMHKYCCHHYDSHLGTPLSWDRSALWPSWTGEAFYAVDGPLFPQLHA